jgi:phage/plasmid-like protein (TIGR03299 family)
MINRKWSDVAGKAVDAKSSAEAIIAAGLDWQVKQALTQTVLDDKVVILDSHKVNYRADTLDIMGLVGNRYTLLQNRDAFSFLDSVIGEQGAHYVNAGSFRNGRKVYIQAVLPDYLTFDDNGDDKGEKYLTFITSHDGSTPIVVVFTPTRIVCQNTFLAAMHDMNNTRSAIRHTMNLAIGLEDARQTLGILNSKFALLESLSRKLAKISFNDDVVKQLAIKSGLVPSVADNSTRADNILSEVVQLFHTGNGSSLTSANGTAWGGFNAVVEYVDHYRGKDAVKRAESSLLGSGSVIKEKALELVSVL